MYEEAYTRLCQTSDAPDEQAESDDDGVLNQRIETLQLQREERQRKRAAACQTAHQQSNKDRADPTRVQERVAATHLPWAEQVAHRRRLLARRRAPDCRVVTPHLEEATLGSTTSRNSSCSFGSTA